MWSCVLSLKRVYVMWTEINWNNKILDTITSLIYFGGTCHLSRSLYQHLVLWKRPIKLASFWGIFCWWYCAWNIITSVLGPSWATVYSYSFICPSRLKNTCFIHHDRTLQKWFVLPSVPSRPLGPFAISFKYTIIHNQLIPGNRVVSMRHIGCPVSVLFPKVSYTYLVLFVDKHPAREVRLAQNVQKTYIC